MKKPPFITPTCGHPSHREPLRIGEINYTAQQINELLSLIPDKADKKEVFPNDSYLGHFPMGAQLPDMDRFAWAFVGDLDKAHPYFYYSKSNVPQGYQSGWNDMAKEFGTYLLTPGKQDQLTAKELFKEKFRLPELTADRAIADEQGNRITDTYVRREAVANHIKQIYNQQFLDNPPLITEGYITPEMLSEETKQMLENTGQEITNLPDGEDLQSVHGVLKLADKQYNPNAYSGLGRRILRKNIVSGVNVLTQSMMKWANTIYVIQYDYDLQGETITVPENCVLRYEGGSIHDGHIIYTDTVIQNEERLFNVTTEGIAVTNLPDGEDLQIKQGVIKFADKEYLPELSSGLGRIYLRKNIKEGKNILTQGMISKPNTIYIIQYDYDLNTEKITIPENCVLQFEGGKFSNGTIVGENTAIKADITNIFETTLILGTWNVKDVYPEWFGAKGEGITDDTKSLQSCFHFAEGKTIHLLKNKIYSVKSTIEVHSNTDIVFDGTVISSLNACFEFFSRTKEQPGYSGVHDVRVHGTGVFDANGQNIENFATPFRIHHCKNITIEGITIKNWFRYHVIEAGGTKGLTIKNVTFKDAYGQKDTENAAAIQVERCSEGGTNGALPYDYTITKDVTISGCVFTTENGSQGYTAIESHDNINDETKEDSNTFSNIVIERCRFENIPNQPGNFYLINLNNNFRDVTIKNNIFENIYENCIHIGRYCDNVCVCDNIFSNMSLTSVSVGNPGDSSYTDTENKYIVISKNKMSKCSKLSGAYPCIYVAKKAKFLIIEGNYIELYNSDSSKPFHMPTSAYSETIIFKDNIIANSSILDESHLIDLHEQMSRFGYKSESAAMGDKYTNYFTDKVIITSKGSTSNRPKSWYKGGILSKEGNIGIGFSYFDTDLGKPIYVKDITSTKVTWVDATGEEV